MAPEYPRTVKFTLYTIGLAFACFSIVIAYSLVFPPRPGAFQGLDKAPTIDGTIEKDPTKPSLPLKLLPHSRRPVLSLTEHHDTVKSYMHAASQHYGFSYNGAWHEQNHRPWLDDEATYNPPYKRYAPTVLPKKFPVRSRSLVRAAFLQNDYTRLDDFDHIKLYVETLNLRTLQSLYESSARDVLYFESCQRIQNEDSSSIIRERLTSLSNFFEHLTERGTMQENPLLLTHVHTLGRYLTSPTGGNNAQD